jgi:hypothetical protein
MFALGFPLLLIPFAIYNIIAFLMPGVSWTGTLTSVHMMSGADWTMSAGDMLIVLAVLLLFGELMKSTGYRWSCFSPCWSSSSWSPRPAPRPSSSCSSSVSSMSSAVSR